MVTRAVAATWPRLCLSLKHGMQRCDRTMSCSATPATRSTVVGRPPISQQPGPPCPFTLQLGRARRNSHHLRGRCIVIILYLFVPNHERFHFVYVHSAGASPHLRHSPNRCVCTGKSCGISLGDDLMLLSTTCLKWPALPPWTVVRAESGEGSTDCTM